VNKNIEYTNIITKELLDIINNDYNNKIKKCNFEKINYNYSGKNIIIDIIYSSGNKQLIDLINNI